MSRGIESLRRKGKGIQLMKKTSTGLIAALALVSLAGCNTVQGIGRDVQAAGKGIQSGSEAVKEEITKDKAKNKGKDADG